MRTNTVEMAAEIEATPGSAETLVDADLLVRIRDPDALTIDVEQFDTEEVQGSSSKRPLLSARKMFDLSASYVLRGPASLATAPTISDLLRSAMMREKPIRSSAIGSVTGGPFVDGETITGGTSLETATVFRDTADGAALIKYYDQSGDFTGSEVLTGSTSGATATTSATPIDNGHAYLPADSDFGGSDSKHHITTRYNRSGLAFLARGCLSNASFLFQAGKPCIVTHRIVGVKDSHSDTALVVPSSFPEQGNAAPKFIAASLTMGGYSPTDIRQMTFLIETNLGIREDANAADGSLYADYDKDAPIITIDPAQVLKATKDFFGDLESDSNFSMSWKIGSVSGMTWDFFADSCEVISAGFGAERTLATTPLQIRLNGVSNNEFAIWQH